MKKNFPAVQQKNSVATTWGDAVQSRTKDLCQVASSQRLLKAVPSTGAAFFFFAKDKNFSA
jgi:hypothetical protein